MVLNVIIWRVGIILELLILFQGCWNKLLMRHPFFYAYIACVFASDISGYFAWRLSMLDFRWYWWSDFLTIIAGYGILIEILKHVPFPRWKPRTVDMVALFVFVTIFSFSLSGLFAAAVRPPSEMVVYLERDLRTAEAVFLLWTAVEILHCGIAIGRNMKGLILGYGLYVGASLVLLATASYGRHSFVRPWVIAQPLSYVIALAIWLWAFRSYYANPAAMSGARHEAFCPLKADRTGGESASFANAAQP